MRRTVVWTLAASLLLCSVPCAGEEYAAAISRHRAEREEQLVAPDGWLTLAGLFWLTPGENRFGSDPGNAIVLEVADVPSWAGTFVYDGEAVLLRTAPEVEIMLGEKSIKKKKMRGDGDGDPDVVNIGRLSLQVIERGDQHGVRVKDPEHRHLQGYHGIEYFPLDAGYRFEAVLKPYDEPRKVDMGTVVGTTMTQYAPGTVEFTIEGRTYSLQPVVSDPADTTLWFIFQDLTSGKETYGFRYLYADVQNGRVDLDFNKAHNPPCAFTPYATCPLPWRENRLDVRIEAGERIYRGY